MNKLLEVIKELLRNATFGIVSYLLTAGVLDALLQQFLGTKLTVTELMLVTTALAYILRSIEKVLHDSNSSVQLPY